MLKEILQAFIKNPSPPWELQSTNALVENKYIADYHSSKFITPNPDPSGHKKKLLFQDRNQTVNIELLTDNLSDFYHKHGLSPQSEEELESNNSVEKIQQAFNFIKLNDEVHASIISLVRSVQVLKQEDPEVDSSYSHPNIPFTIFVSVCVDSSTVSNLRVAESILHEAMHLKLTLLENEIPLIIPNPKGLFFSPWRDEKRPARGVLHGLFVFRSILGFYSDLCKSCKDKSEQEYLKGRIQQITEEIAQLKDFHLCPDLTEGGAILTTNLLPSN